MAALTVLLRQESSPLLQFLVGASLVVGLLGVPGLATAQAIQRLDDKSRRVAVRAVGGAFAVASAVIVAFIAQSVVSGNAGVGAPSAAGAPEATTGGVAKVTARAAALLGKVRPRGSATTYSFEYGVSTTYGRSTAA